MGEIQASDFLAQLHDGKLRSTAHLFGLVKKSDNRSELLFAFKGESLDWIKIPESMIDHVHMIRKFHFEGECVAKVKIALKEPPTAEGRVLYDLLSGLSHKVSMMKEMMKKDDKGKESRTQMGHCGCRSGMHHRCGEHHH